MQVVFNTDIRETFAIGPRYQKGDGKIEIRFNNYQKCGEFLVVRAPLGYDLDLLSEDIQNMIASVADRLFDFGTEIPLGKDNLYVSCYDFMKNFRKNESKLSLKDVNGTYAFAGCRYDSNQDLLTVHIPGRENHANYSVDVTLSIDYKIAPKIRDGKEYFAVKFPNIEEYVDGSIYYLISFEGKEYRCPVINNMLNNILEIRTPDGKEPNFKSETRGIRLRRIGY